MIKLQDAVLKVPSFEKTATYELPKDVTNWNSEILEKFFEEINYLPKDINTEIVVNSIDENKGYAKGSVVVWYGTRKLNFPIIIKDFQLYPFDIYITEKDGKFKYNNATETNVKTYLMSSEIGKIENMYDAAMGANIKTPGNISPKRHINLSDDYNVDWISAFPNFTKMSAYWREEDFNHLKETLEKNADVAHAFTDTTGDRVNNIINLNRGTRSIPRDKAEGKLDLNNIVDTKQALTVIDSEMFDTSKLIPIKPPSVCELRLYQYPSMEDFMDRGASELLRFSASKVGKPITGVVLDYKNIESSNCNCPAICEPSPLTNQNADPIEKARAIRNSRPQMFICSEGKYYVSDNDYGKSGICFYGSNVLSIPGMVDKVVERIANKTTNDYLRFNKDSHGNGDDKIFHRNLELRQGKENVENENAIKDNYAHIIPWPATVYPNFGSQSKNLLIIYGGNDAYECVQVSGPFKRYRVNGTTAYACRDIALIPARISVIQQVGSVTDPVYKMIAGESKKVYLIPENSIVINMDFMEQLNKSDLMTPSRPIQKIYEEASILKIAIDLGSDGYRIYGTPIKPLQKIAHFNDDTCLNTKDAMNVLKILGMEKTAAEKALKNVLIKNAETPGSAVIVYGVRNDYINPKLYDGIEKQARITAIYKQLAAELKTDLIKEASVISDPEAVDVMLSLNFINEDNLNEYIDQIHVIKKVIGKLSAMLVASRMGLSDIDENATKKAIDGLDNVVKGLENIKLSISNQG
jgi:hypothetical protein